MPSTATKAFEEFKRKNALTATQRQKIRERKDRVRRYLEDDGWNVVSAIFGGSHARGTKVRLPGDAKADVDVYIILNASHKSSYGGIFGPEPKQLLTDIKASLDKKLSTPSVRADSPSVRIRYEDMDVDVVPAFRRMFFGGFEIPYYDRWLVATPEEQRKRFSKLNENTGYRAVHLVRILKYWKAIHASFPLRSYHLEVLAYEIFRDHTPSDYRHAIKDFFVRAQTYVRYAYSDPGGSGNSVTGYMTSAQRDTAISMFKSAAARAQAAIDKPTWSDEIAAWRASTMFGSRFPPYSA